MDQGYFKIYIFLLIAAFLSAAAENGASDLLQQTSYYYSLHHTVFICVTEAITVILTASGFRLLFVTHS